MRIAYVAPYQGPTLLARRPIIRNRSMSNRIKIELIASLLKDRSHDVEVISQGEVIDRSMSFYPAFVEPERFHPEVPVYYGSVLPVRHVNGLWSNARTLQLLKERHRAKPYDLMLLFNLKGPQLACADYAIRRLSMPVVLEYEDDRFVTVDGKRVEGLSAQWELRTTRRLFKQVSGCIGVSPHLLSQLPTAIPSLLLRGVVGSDLVEATTRVGTTRKNLVLFSGTHIASNGVGELIQGWRQLNLDGWELHITGYGGLTESLRKMAEGVPGITFHGMVERPELVRLMTSAAICMNPHQVSDVPGNVFAFKIIEYLAAGAHVITTRMGALEPDLEAGMTYMPDNAPETIARTIRHIVAERAYERSAMPAAQARYGPAAVAESLDALIRRVAERQRIH